MAIDVGIVFPTEAAALTRHLQSEISLTPTKRLRAADDLYVSAVVLSKAGGMWSAALKRHADLEAEWRRRILELIAKHDASR